MLFCVLVTSSKHIVVKVNRGKMIWYIITSLFVFFLRINVIYKIGLFYVCVFFNRKYLTATYIFKMLRLCLVARLEKSSFTSSVSELLEKHGLEKPISFVKNTQSSAEEARKLMVRLTRHTGRKWVIKLVDACIWLKIRLLFFSSSLSYTWPTINWHI